MRSSSWLFFLAAVVRADEVDAEEQAVGEHQLPRRDRLGAREQNGVLGVEGDDLGVVPAGLADLEAKLVEAQLAADEDGEGAGDQLQVEAAPVAGGNLVEAVALVGDHAGEDVEAARGAAGVGPGGDLSREVELLDDRDEVRAVALEDGPVPQVDLAHAELGKLGLDPFPFGQEAAAQTVGGFAEAQVDAGGLDAGGRDPVALGGDDALVDGPLQPLARQDAPEAGRQIERCGHRAVSSHGAQYGRQPIRSGGGSCPRGQHRPGAVIPPNPEGFWFLENTFPSHFRPTRPAR